MNDSYIGSTLRSMGDDIAKLSEMQEIQNESIEYIVDMAVSVNNSVRMHQRFIEKQDEDIWRLRDDLRRWKALVGAMAGWILVVTVLWCFGMI